VGRQPPEGGSGLKIKVERLSLWYGPKQALHGITLAIPDRAVTALIGPSGCGKSTFLRCLNLMHELTPEVRVSGRVRLDGRDILALLGSERRVTELRRRVGMLFQRPNLFPGSIFDNVAFAPRLQGSRDVEQVVAESLQAAALWEEVKDRLHESARSLSGGQQQRLCIARALAAGPEVLLLDEPTSALDPASAAAVETLIQRLSENLTIVIVTHNLAQGARLADQAAFFLDGCLIEAGPRLFTAPADPRTAGYLAGTSG
jgi:phosphate transport system ATP-binding protein